MIVGVINAQEIPTIEPTLDYNKIVKAVAKSDADIQDPLKQKEPKTWVQRAETFMDAQEVNIELIYAGIPHTMLQQYVGETKDVLPMKRDSTDNNRIKTVFVYERINIYLVKQGQDDKNKVVEKWIETKPINNNSLFIALESLKKANELDVEKKTSKKIKKTYERLAILAKKCANNEYIWKSYDKAFDLFDIVAQSTSNELVNKLDTSSCYFAAAAAYLGKLSVDKQKKYSTICKDLKYGGQEAVKNAYIFLTAAYETSKDTAQIIAVCNEAIPVVASNDIFIGKLVDIFNAQRKYDESLSLMQKLIAKRDTSEYRYRIVEANIYSQMRKFDEAIKSCDMVLTIKPENQIAILYKGILLSNQGKDLINKSNEATNTTDSEKYKNEAREKFKQAVPFLKKAHENNPKDKDILNELKGVYLRLQMEAELKEVDEKLKAL